MKFSFSPSSTNLEKVEEGTQRLPSHETAITCILPVRNRHIIIGD